MADDPVAADADNNEDEVIRRQRREEEEMERLLLAQEHDDNQEPPPQQQEDQDLDLQQALQEDMLAPPVIQQRYSKRLPYTQTSFLAAFLLVYYALRTRQQWYLALVYLTSSKWAYIVLGNALIALCVSTFRFFTKTFLQGLRLAEAEGLGDFFRWNVTETCLALTMFRSELDIHTFLIFLVLILAKCLHWVAEMREGHLRMTQEAVVPIESGILKGFPKIPSTHLGLFFLLGWLMVLDIAAVAQCGYDIHQKGPSVAILFGFETAILLVTAMSSMILWNLHLVDGILHYLHDHTSSARWIHCFLHTWKDHKATLIFAVEVQAQGATFLFYVTFFAIVLTYYGLPINLFREVYLSFQKLRSRLLAFANYRRLMASMDRFDSVASDDELEEAGRVCIICRDEMTLQGSKRLPGCGHVFHKSCLREWLVQQQSCPTCRGDIASIDGSKEAPSKVFAVKLAGAPLLSTKNDGSKERVHNGNSEKSTTLGSTQAQQAVSAAAKAIAAIKNGGGSTTSSSLEVQQQPPKRKRAFSSKSTSVDMPTAGDSNKKKKRERKKLVAHKSVGASWKMPMDSKPTSDYSKVELEAMPRVSAVSLKDGAKMKARSTMQANNNKEADKGHETKGPKKQKAPKKKKTPSTSVKSSLPRKGAKEVWCGQPDEPLDGGWPDGWVKRVFERVSGATKGDKDRYWYSPKAKKKFRSMAEIKRYMPLLKACEGDEDQAWQLFKNR